MSAADRISRRFRFSQLRSYFWHLGALLGRWPRRIAALGLLGAAVVSFFYGSDGSADLAMPPRALSSRADRAFDSDLLSEVDIPDPRVVPIRLADPQLAQILHRGDRIDVLVVSDLVGADPAIRFLGDINSSGGKADELGAGALAAADVPVLAVMSKPDAQSDSALVVVEASAQVAQRLAAANLQGPLAVTLRAANGDSELPNPKDDHAQ